MNDTLHEQVSALADDELDVREAELLLARMQREPRLRAAWEHYHLVGEAMRGRLARADTRGLVASVAAAIDSETAPTRGVSDRMRDPSVVRPVAGFAIAASVAMLAVFTLDVPRNLPAEVVPSGGETPLAVPRGSARNVDFTGVRSEALQNQLRGYLLNHREHSSSPRIRGVMPYVQIAAHETRPVKVDVDEIATREPPEWRD